MKDTECWNGVMKPVDWLVDLQGQLTQAEQHAAQYKSIADSVESSLREQTAASEQFRQTLEARVTETLQGTHLLLMLLDLYH